MNIIGYFEIQSSNPVRDLQFYQAIFGWTFVKVDDLPIEYYRIKTRGLDGGLLQRPAPVAPPEYGTNAFACSFIVEDFDEIAEKILQHGGKLAMPKFAVPGRCWQGYFIDMDNNVFGIFQADENAE